MNNIPIIYADYGATAPLLEPVRKEMLPYLSGMFGNPSAAYSLGRAARRAVETARDRAACFLGCENREIFFTSGGTESDNWALRGCMERLAARGKRHLITSAFEHPAVENTCRWLESQGIRVTRLPVDSQGYVTAGQVEKALAPDTGLVSIMYANNEIGTIQPIPQIGKLCRERGVLFHTDAVQAAGSLPIQVKEQQIDLLSLSAHKLGGPKGAGLLYLRSGVEISPLIQGGEQERGFRSGTENVAAIVGLGKALELAGEGREQRTAYIASLRDRLLEQLLQIPGSQLNGGLSPRLCGNLNLSFAGINGEELLLMLDLRGICASAGSACTTGSREPSRVLRAIGLSEELSKSALRITLGAGNTPREVDAIAAACREIVGRLRS